MGAGVSGGVKGRERQQAVLAQSQPLPMRLQLYFTATVSSQVCVLPR